MMEMAQKPAQTSPFYMSALSIQFGGERGRRFHRATAHGFGCMAPCGAVMMV